MVSVPLPQPGVSPSPRWKVKLIDRAGVRILATAVALDGEVNSDLAIAAFGQLQAALGDAVPVPPLAAAFRHARVPEMATPGRDAINTWADDSADLWRSPRLEDQHGWTRRVGDGLGWFDRGRLRTAAWHDKCLLAFYVPPGTRRFEVSYRETSDARRERRQFLRTWPGPWWRRLVARLNSESVAEWVAFCGEGTTTISGERVIRRWWRRSFGVDHDGRQGVVRVWVFQQLGRPDKLTRDPTFQARLAHWLARIGPLADHHPELGSVPNGSLGSGIVLVHGTLSSGLASLQPLVSQLSNVIPHATVLRFEHDTFLPIEDSAHELTDLLRRKMRADGSSRVVLLGHSRGGLVCRYAACDYLSELGHQDVESRGPLRHGQLGVATFGSPHEGTPVATAGGRVLSGLASAATFGVGQVPSIDPATPLLRYLFGRMKRLPPGISDMAIKSRFLRHLDFADRAIGEYQLLTYGANYLAGENPGSRGEKLLSRFGHDLFIGEDRKHAANDLVVSVSSATARGKGTCVAGACGHFGYFSEPEVSAAVSLLRLSKDIGGEARTE